MYFKVYDIRLELKGLPISSAYVSTLLVLGPSRRVPTIGTLGIRLAVKISHRLPTEISATLQRGYFTDTCPNARWCVADSLEVSKYPKYTIYQQLSF